MSNLTLFCNHQECVNRLTKDYCRLRPVMAIRRTLVEDLTWLSDSANMLSGISNSGIRAQGFLDGR